MTMHRYAPLAIDEIFELANSKTGDEQLAVLSHYTTNNSGIKTLMELYSKELPVWVADLEYKQPLQGAAGYTSVLNSIRTINQLLSKDNIRNKQRFEGIMETIALPEMMFMEHFVQKSLETYYPNVDFTYFGVK